MKLKTNMIPDLNLWIEDHMAVLRLLVCLLRGLEGYEVLIVARSHVEVRGRITWKAGARMITCPGSLAQMAFRIIILGQVYDPLT